MSIATLYILFTILVLLYIISYSKQQQRIEKINIKNTQLQKQLEVFQKIINSIKKEKIGAYFAQNANDKTVTEKPHVNPTAIALTSQKYSIPSKALKIYNPFTAVDCTGTYEINIKFIKKEST